MLEDADHQRAWNEDVNPGCGRRGIDRAVAGIVEFARAYSAGAGGRRQEYQARYFGADFAHRRFHP